MVVFEEMNEDWGKKKGQVQGKWEGEVDTLSGDSI